jgi:hypothetical protein
MFKLTDASGMLPIFTGMRAQTTRIYREKTVISLRIT